MKRFLLFFQDGTRWLFAGDFATQYQAESLTGLTPHCLIIDTQEGIRLERFSPMGEFHQIEEQAAA
jgi:hypothetical protein